jgi:tRNA pseudouridine13 synthase
VSAAAPGIPARPPRVRVRLEDFEVEEIPLYTPRGEGSHTFVWVEKCDRTTEDVARELARRAGVRAGEVGYAGRKDRRALTRQWFSIPGAGPEDALGFVLRGARVLEAHRHPHKLRVGQLRGNRFSILVRDVPDALRSRLGARLAHLEQIGMSNRYGPQRYGRDGSNARQGAEVLRGALRPRDRRHARFLLSALQARAFDDVLAERPLPLDVVEVGDVAQVCKSGGLFRVEDLQREAPRARRFEISATGPIFGTRMPTPSGAPAERERAVSERWGLHELAASAALPRLRGGRRPLRVRPREATLSAEGQGVRLRFALPAGSYATVFLEEVLGERPAEGGPASRAGEAS